MSDTPAPISETALALLEEVVESIEADDAEAAQMAIDALGSESGDDSPVHSYARGLYAWAAGDWEEAASRLMNAVDEGLDYAPAYLDCAEFMLDSGHPLEEAEAPLRVLLGRDGLDASVRDEAMLMLAQVRLEDDDPDEALEIAEGVSAKEGQTYFGVRASIAMASGKPAEGVSFMEKAVEEDPEDADALYHLGIALHLAGREADCAEVMIKVLEADAEDDGLEPSDDTEDRALIAVFEEVLENLPEPLMKRVANANVVVQDRPTHDQIRAGIDPRGGVALLGTPTGPKGDPDDAKLEGIVINRGPLYVELVNEDDVPEALLRHLLVEFRRFFAMEKLAVVAV